MTQTPTNDSEQATVDEYLPCIDSHCDGQGTTLDGSTDEPYPAQCEYCYKVRFPAKTAINRLLIKRALEELQSLNMGIIGYKTKDQVQDVLTDRIATLQAELKRLEQS